jgi:hypothetical protein
MDFVTEFSPKALNSLSSQFCSLAFGIRGEQVAMFKEEMTLPMKFAVNEGCYK